MKEAITSTLNQQGHNSNKMKLLLLKGFGYDPSEVERHAIANVFKTWSEVEVYLQAIIDDTRSVFTSYLYGDKMQFTETLHRRNGNLVGYVCKLCFDMTNPEHRELYTGIIFDNWSTAKNYQWSENANIRTHELTVASLWVKEVEI